MTLKDLCNRYNDLSNLCVGYQRQGLEDDARLIEARMEEVYFLARTFFPMEVERVVVIKKGVVTFNLV